VIAPRIEAETRRGRDYVRVTISMTASAPDVAQALTAAWWAFRKAASEDTAGWDMASAVAGALSSAKLSEIKDSLRQRTQVDGEGTEAHAPR